MVDLAGRSRCLAVLVGLAGAVLSGLGASSGCGGGSGVAGAEGVSVDHSAVRRVAGLMEGRFSSARQASGNPAYLAIEVRVGRVERWSGDGVVYLYMEQALAGSSPYRQRVYRIEPGEGDAVLSRVLWLPGDDLGRFVGAWRDEGLLEGVEVGDLEDRGCVVELRPTPGDGRWSWAGSTRGMGCPSDFRGAVRATSEVKLGEGGFSAWDRGWGPTDEQVWGPREGAYVFDRVGERSAE